MFNTMINGDKIMVGATQSPANSFIFCGALIAATTTAVGGVFKLQNTMGLDLIVTDALLDVTTASTGVATLDIGVDDDGATSNDTLFDGLDVNTAAGLFNAHKHAGTNGLHALVWKKDEYLVATASATVAGLVGNYKIYAIAR